MFLLWDWDKPYKGLKVVDASQGFADACSGLLALYGADVIKIEPPEGDWAAISAGTCRTNGAAYRQEPWQAGISLNLKQPRARKIVHLLAKDCDVFLEVSGLVSLRVWISRMSESAR